MDFVTFIRAKMKGSYAKLTESLLHCKIILIYFCKQITLLEVNLK